MLVTVFYYGLNRFIVGKRREKILCLRLAFHFGKLLIKFLFRIIPGIQNPASDLMRNLYACPELLRHDYIVRDKAFCCFFRMIRLITGNAGFTHQGIGAHVTHLCDLLAEFTVVRHVPLMRFIDLPVKILFFQICQILSGIILIIPDHFPECITSGKFFKIIFRLDIALCVGKLFANRVCERLEMRCHNLPELRNPYLCLILRLRLRLRLRLGLVLQRLHIVFQSKEILHGSHKLFSGQNAVSGCVVCHFRNRPDRHCSKCIMQFSVISEIGTFRVVHPVELGFVEIFTQQPRLILYLFHRGMHSNHTFRIPDDVICWHSVVVAQIRHRFVQCILCRLHDLAGKLIELFQIFSRIRGLLNRFVLPIRILIFALRFLLPVLPALLSGILCLFIRSLLPLQLYAGIQQLFAVFLHFQRTLKALLAGFAERAVKLVIDVHTGIQTFLLDIERTCLVDLQHLGSNLRVTHHRRLCAFHQLLKLLHLLLEYVHFRRIRMSDDLPAVLGLEFIADIADGVECCHLAVGFRILLLRRQRRSKRHCQNL